MDFYASLPSNASPDVYPDNKTSHFKIELSKRMELHGRWKAALIEFHYPNTFQHVTPHENEIIVETPRYTHSFYLRPGWYSSTAQFLTAIREVLNTVDGDSNDITPTIRVEETADHRVIVHPFHHDDSTTITFSPRLSLQLGLENPGPFPGNTMLRGVKPMDLTLGISPQMYIYMDILEDQIVGHTRAPLLRTVPVDTKAAYGTMSVCYFEHPIYFDLNTKSFDTVKIHIRDSTGHLISFDHGTSTLLVHFKQV